MGEPYRPRKGERVRVVLPDTDASIPARVGDEGVVGDVLTFTNTGLYTVRIRSGWAIAVELLGPRRRPTVLHMVGGEVHDGPGDDAVPSECGGWLHLDADSPRRQPSWCLAPTPEPSR